MNSRSLGSTLNSEQPGNSWQKRKQSGSSEAMMMICSRPAFVLAPTQRLTLLETGFLILDVLIADAELNALREESDRLLSESPGRGGMRNVLQKSALLADFAA